MRIYNLTASISEAAGYLGAVFGLWLIGIIAAMVTIWLRLRRTDVWSGNGWRQKMNAAERIAISLDRPMLAFVLGLALVLTVGELA